MSEAPLSGLNKPLPKWLPWALAGGIVLAAVTFWADFPQQAWRAGQLERKLAERGFARDAASFRALVPPGKGDALKELRQVKDWRRIVGMVRVPPAAAEMVPKWLEFFEGSPDQASALRAASKAERVSPSVIPWTGEGSESQKMDMEMVGVGAEVLAMAAGAKARAGRFEEFLSLSQDALRLSRLPSTIPSEPAARLALRSGNAVLAQIEIGAYGAKRRPDILASLLKSVQSLPPQVDLLKTLKGETGLLVARAKLDLGGAMDEAMDSTAMQDEPVRLVGPLPKTGPWIRSPLQRAMSGPILAWAEEAEAILLAKEKTGTAKAALFDKLAARIRKDHHLTMSRLQQARPFEGLLIEDLRHRSQRNTLIAYLETLIIEAETGRPSRRLGPIGSSLQDLLTEGPLGFRRTKDGFRIWAAKDPGQDFGGVASSEGSLTGYDLLRQAPPLIENRGWFISPPTSAIIPRMQAEASKAKDQKGP